MTIDLNVLEGLQREATPGEWAALRNHPSVWTADGERAISDTSSSSRIPIDEQVVNAALIAAAVNALPELIAAARERDGLREALEKIAADGGPYRSGYCQTDISVDPSLTAEEAQAVARQALQAGEKG